MAGANHAATQAGGTSSPAVPCPLPDGFHLLPWRELHFDGLKEGWQTLANAAATPNSFYEPWFLIPSLIHLDPAGLVHLALLVDDGVLKGLMPCWINSDYHGRNLPNAAPWLHANMFCATPLIAPGSEPKFWAHYLNAVDICSKTKWFAHFPQMPINCPVTRSLFQLCENQRRPLRTVLRAQRAVLNRGPSPSDHLAVAMSAKRRKELRRQRKRLSEVGTIAILRSRNADGLEQWIEDFIKLESQGWKGDAGSALASQPETERLFRDVMVGAAANGRLERLSLTCDGNPIAMLATFLAFPGSFSFKTAYDESFYRFSPGVLLQMENLALLEDEGLEWCDSCAASDHPMIEHIWRDKRAMVWLTAAAGRGWRRHLGALWARIEERRAEQKS